MKLAYKIKNSVHNASCTIHYDNVYLFFNLRFQEVAKEQKQRRENQVTLYRKYRIGDLPDIQIKYSALIAPLQALAQVPYIYLSSNLCSVDKF